jgi:archaellum component FlaC
MLLEHSDVSVPANINALTVAVAKGLKISPEMMEDLGLKGGEGSSNFGHSGRPGEIGGSGGGGGRGDRNSDEASDRRAFSREKKRCDAAIAEANTRIAELNDKLNPQAAIDRMKSKLAEIGERKAALAKRHEEVTQRMAALKDRLAELRRKSEESDVEDEIDNLSDEIASQHKAMMKLADEAEDFASSIKSMKFVREIRIVKLVQKHNPFIRLSIEDMVKEKVKFVLDMKTGKV